VTLYAIHESEAQAAESLLRQLSEVSAGTAGAARWAPAAHEPALEAGTARLGLRGVLVRQAPTWAVEAGLASSAEGLRAQFERLAGDDRVARVVLEVDSPGGAFSGAVELADALSALAARKPVEARVGGLAASAAYLAISGASSIVAGPSSTVGSIGTYLAALDASEALRRDGLRLVVVRSSPLKGVGVGAISAEQEADLQRVVDAAQEQFTARVARGRGLEGEALARVTTGQTWFGDEAQALGLVDAVRTGGEEIKVNEQVTALKAENEELRSELQSLQAKTQAVASENETLKARAQALELRNADLEAEAKAQAETEAKRRHDECLALIDGSPSRVTEPLKASALLVAESSGWDPGKVRAFVESLPEQSRPVQQGQVPERRLAASDREGAREAVALKASELAQKKGVPFAVALDEVLATDRGLGSQAFGA
jgi:signal peptide peptidase SppA